MTKKLVLAVGALAAAGVGIYFALAPFRIELPEAKRPAKSMSLPQNWDAGQQAAFHHTAQGTKLLPWEWFQALEQPCLSLLGCGDLADPAYLTRFGFIPSDENKDRLPVGFARQDNFHDPILKRTYPVVGFTCAACHTGEMFYGEYAIRIEGGVGMADLGAFQKAMGLALVLNDKIPGRYKRFEARVLGKKDGPEEKAKLRKDLDAFMAQAMREREYTKKHGIYDNQAGFGRTDALTRIGNQVFAVDLDLFQNFAVSNAPVRFPQIWDAPWFDWVQYNSSIADPLVRNIGEALGVRALLNPADLDNSVDVGALLQLETLLAGPGPFQGLQSPKWPGVFPALDMEKVKKGETLYREHCQGCHMPPVPELLADKGARYWEDGRLKVTDINIQEIGTDPRAALDYRNRTADGGALGKGLLTAAEGLEAVTGAIADRFFKLQKLTPPARGEWVVRDKLIYKARPLNGIWAVAPYLHNGSVPNLYQLLSPKAERPERFWTGNKEFDPKVVGYKSEPFAGGFLYDTTLVGNSNAGHEFADGPRGNGVIGPFLCPECRWAIVEYLKWL